MEAVFNQWNLDLSIFHKWALLEDRCLLCSSVGPCIVADSKAVCMLCLTEFPQVPWHPTGAVRAKFETLLAHILAGCESHGTSSDSLTNSIRRSLSENSATVSEFPFRLS
jgi:hypothetical protein